MHKLRENAEKELRDIAEKGLSPSNLDNAYKLVEIVKGVDKINMMQDGGYSRDGYSRDMEDYSREGGYGFGNSRDYGGNSRDGYSREGDYANDGYSNGDNAYDRGNSYRRGRSQTTGRYVHRPNYSRLSGDDADMDRYQDMKKDYSNTGDEKSKECMLESLEHTMRGVYGMMKAIYRDSTTREEKEIIQNWAHKIAEL